MKKAISLILTTVILVGCGNATTEIESAVGKSVASKKAEEIDLAGTYIGLHGSGITLFNDGKAEYYWKEWENVETGDTWEYKDNKVIFHSQSLGYDICAAIEDGNTSTLNFVGVGDTDWNDEMFVKVSGDVSSKDMSKYISLIEKQLNIKIDQPDLDERKSYEYAGFKIELPGSFKKDNENDEMVTYSDNTNEMLLVVCADKIRYPELSESDIQKINDRSEEYMDRSLTKIIDFFQEGITMDSDGVSVIDIANDDLASKTVRVYEDDICFYYTFYYDRKTIASFFTVLSDDGDSEKEQIYNQIVKSVKYVDIDKETNSEVSSDLKEFLDSYEAFMDEYVEFMQNYKKNPTDLSMIADYAEMLQKYNEFAEKAEKYDTNDMSKEEAKYYLDVMNRVNKKLLEVADN